jgi:hypothetical protein
MARNALLYLHLVAHSGHDTPHTRAEDGTVVRQPVDETVLMIVKVLTTLITIMVSVSRIGSAPVSSAAGVLI